jgi:hypothetical protein
LSDGDNNNEQKSPLTMKLKVRKRLEPIAPNSTESSMAGDSCPSAVDQITPASSGSRQKKKNGSAIQAKKTATPSIFRSNAANTIKLTGYTRQSITHRLVKTVNILNSATLILQLSVNKTVRLKLYHKSKTEQ